MRVKYVTASTTLDDIDLWDTKIICSCEAACEISVPASTSHKEMTNAVINNLGPSDVTCCGQTVGVNGFANLLMYDGAFAVVIGGGGGGHSVIYDGDPLAQEPNLVIEGNGTFVRDDAGEESTIITVASPVVYQEWASYEDSPADARAYPYQTIVEFEGDPYLFAFDRAVYQTTPIFARDGVWVWTGEIWLSLDYGSGLVYLSDFIGMASSASNFDIWDESDKQTLIFPRSYDKKTGPAGHVIWDADGDGMTQRGNLWFSGAAQVSDDEIEGATVVYIPAPDEATNGLPTGGTVGQKLVKIDSTNYNAEWADDNPAFNVLRTSLDLYLYDDGDDNNDGLTPATALATWAAVEARLTAIDAQVNDVGAAIYIHNVDLSGTSVQLMAWLNANIYINGAYDDGDMTQVNRFGLYYFNNVWVEAIDYTNDEEPYISNCKRASVVQCVGQMGFRYCDLAQMGGCDCTGPYAGIYLSNVKRVELEDNFGTTPYSGLIAYGDTHIFVDGEYPTGAQENFEINDGGTIEFAQAPAICDAYTGEQWFTFDAATQKISAYDPDGGTYVKIPPTIGGVPVRVIGLNVFQGTDVIEVIFPDSVITMEQGLFWNESSLQAVTIGRNTQSLGAGVFTGVSVSQIFIPRSVMFMEESTLDAVTEIIGYTGSYAETYATAYSRTFVPYTDSVNPTVRNHIHGNFEVEGNLYLNGGVAGNPTGAMIMFAGSLAPAGYLLCDGTSYLRTTYPLLFAIIGTTFGNVDATHFNVPDMRSAFPRGKGASDALGDTGGSETYTPEGTNASGSVADHTFTQPSAHSNHTFTQPSAHSNHTFTQPDNHANHVHSGSASHTSVSTKQGSSSGNVVTTNTHGNTGNNTSTLSHSGGAVDAHSAHSGGAVDAHSAHTGGAVDAHSFTQPTFTGDEATVLPPFVNLNYIIKT